MDHTMPTLYENNVATIMGGAIYGDLNSTIIKAQGHFMFQNNMADVSTNCFSWTAYLCCF